MKLSDTIHIRNCDLFMWFKYWICLLPKESILVSFVDCFWNKCCWQSRAEKKEPWACAALIGWCSSGPGFIMDCEITCEITSRFFSSLLRSYSPPTTPLAENHSNIRGNTESMKLNISNEHKSGTSSLTRRETGLTACEWLCNEFTYLLII